MKKLTEYQAIIVDLDGTLYYQKPVRIAMLKEMIMHFWRITDFLVVSRYRSMFEKGIPEKERYSRLPSGSKSIITEWMYKRPLKYLNVYRDDILIDYLEKRKSEGVTVILYSDYDYSDKLNSLGFMPDVSFSSNDLGCMKPNPEGILKELIKLNIKPSTCLIIGDREEKDGLLAKAMGADYIILGKDTKERESYYKNNMLM